MKMLRRFIRISAFMAVVAGTSMIAAPTVLAAPEAPLNALTVPTFIPFESLDRDTGKMVGFDMDILANVADRAGFTYQVNTLEFSGIVPALQTGSGDVALAAITITPERAKVIDFSIPYYHSGLGILIRDGTTGIADLDDLKGHSIATKIGSTGYDFLQEKFGKTAEIKPYPNTEAMYLALMSGAADALFYDLPNLAYFAKTKGEGKVKVVGPTYEAQPYGIAFVKGSKWVEPSNQALRAMQADGTYAAIYEKWFGEKPSADQRIGD